MSRRSEAARDGWLAAEALGRIAEHADRDALRVVTAFLQEPVADDPLFAALRSRHAATVFTDYARDAAAAYGHAAASAPLAPLLAAIVEGIRIIDDIQDDEPQCVATDVGTDRALQLAMGLFAHGLELAAALPFDAIAVVGRGIRETAIGQELETTAGGDFESFWNAVDRKTPPLVATALELGALAAGAAPSSAAALTQLAVPLGRLLQVGDDCHDALGTDASDWRAPHHNLLMLYSLSGPSGRELAALLRNGGDPHVLRTAQHCLLRDGALAYAIHVQLTTLQSLAATLETLDLPDPTPFRRALDDHRTAAEQLLRTSGVQAELAASL